MRAQALAVLREFGLPADAAHVNPSRGVIALGHALATSGALRVGRRAPCTICVGAGQGAALVPERV